MERIEYRPSMAHARSCSARAFLQAHAQCVRSCNSSVWAADHALRLGIDRLPLPNVTDDATGAK